MPEKASNIIQEVDGYIKKGGRPYGDWYVGITDNPIRRLFLEHNVSRETGQWIYREAYSDTSAREVESFFLDYKGTQGGPGGGDENSRFVYAYRITSATKE